MKTHGFKVGAGVAVALLCAVGIAVSSQGQMSSRGMPMYDPATEVTVKGTVEGVNQVAGRGGWAGTHLTLKSEKETFDVHVGPSWFLTREKAEFAKGDTIEVLGSKITYNGGPAILAREITKGEKKLTLRNPQGFPVWSRGRRR